jgi:Ca-activated chloride channel family protein
MATRFGLFLVFCSGLAVVAFSGHAFPAQDQSSRFFVNVVLVQLNVAVTDRHGNYITKLRPEDFDITEDKIPEKIATFEEGGAPGGGTGDTAETDRSAASQGAAGNDDAGAGPGAGQGRTSGLPLAGASVFILFDSSDYMYRGFVYAQDAIAGFVRSMAGGDKIAYYSYSRNLLRATPLTTDRTQVMQGVRNTVAGDEAALYNCLLLTVQDAAQLRGRKAVVVFSNGPDNASSVPPEDVEELAQSTGTIIYIISTRQAQDEPVSSAVFERMSKGTGGKAYFAKDWRDEGRAFSSIQDDLAHLYTISYYPKLNPNRGWRTISVKLVGKDLQKYRIRTRDGYRLEEAVPAGSPAPAGEASGAGRSDQSTSQSSDKQKEK